MRKFKNVCFEHMFETVSCAVNDVPELLGRTTFLTICIFLRELMLMINKLKGNHLKDLSKQFCSSSESSEQSEKLSKSSIICLISFFKCICTLLKIIVNNSFHLY